MTLEQEARRAARRVGLVARKSRSGFSLVDDRDRIVVRAHLTPEAVIDLCTAAFNYGGAE